MTADPSSPLTELLRLPAGSVDLADLDPAGTPGFSGKKADAPAATEALAPELSDLQERLYAVGRTAEDQAPKVLVVLQGMDTSGKGGAIRHAIGLVDPQGVRIKAFKAPTAEERQPPLPVADRARGAPSGHDRHLRPVAVRGRAGGPGATTWCRRRSGSRATTRSTRSSRELVDDGTVLIKCFLHISSTEQKERLLDRLEDPTKHWKYNPGDVDVRAQVGRLPGRRTPTRWSGAAPSRRRGTSSRRTGSGTATGPWPSC